MADVFISYSQRAPEPTEALAEDLGERGYAYWFDTRLLPSDVFWRVIMKRITDAKAVIVIWSPMAVESDWVYGEAKLAHEQKKLICVRTDDVSAAAVPLPFNGYNVTPVNERDAIYAALGRLQVPVKPKGGFEAPAGDPSSGPQMFAGPRQGAPSVTEVQFAWAQIKDSTDAADFEVFAEHYGSEHRFFAHLARKRIAELRPEGGGEGVILPPARGPRERRPGGLGQLLGGLFGGRETAEREVAVGPPMPLPQTPVPLPQAPAAPAPSRGAAAEIADAADDVVLRIEPGMHSAVIRRISVSADGRMLATGSHDKTVRLWSVTDGRLLRTLRGPIGPGNDGKIYAVAMAPDASWVAVGGWVGASGTNGHVTVFDTATGAVIARLGPLPNVVLDLAVSPDGQRLAAGLGDGGIRVWARSSSPGPSKGEGDWRLAFEDRDFGDRVLGLDFAADGRVFATSYDGHVRAYDANGRLAAKVKAPGGARPFGIAVSPDRNAIAVGYDDTTAVDVFDATTLTHAFAADTSGVSGGSLSCVAWRADGALAAAGRYPAGRRKEILLWADGGRGPHQTLPGPSNTVMDLATCGDGLAFGAGDPAFGLVDAHGRRALFRGPPMADLRNAVRDAFQVSADGRQVRFGLQWRGRKPHLIDLTALTFAPAPAADGLAPARTEGLAIAGWEHTTAPTLDGAPLTLRAHDMARSLATAPDAKSFVLGTEYRLRRFAASGAQIWQQPVPGTVWGVNLARDGRLVIAAYGDGTIRWHRGEDGAELLALYVAVDWGADPDAPTPVATDWVLWTPKGHYTGSPGCDALIGWHVNRDEGILDGQPSQARLSRAADFYPADTFAATFKKPDIVRAALDEI